MWNRLEISWIKLRPLKRFAKLLRIFPSLFLTFTSCAHGLYVTTCVIDTVNSGFQCGNDKSEYFLPYKAGTDLICTSSEDMEAYFKACNPNNLFTPPSCSFDTKVNGFICTNGSSINPNWNYFCLSSKDRGRLDDRCRL